MEVELVLEALDKIEELQHFGSIKSSGVTNYGKSIRIFPLSNPIPEEGILARPRRDAAERSFVAPNTNR